MVIVGTKVLESVRKSSAPSRGGSDSLGEGARAGIAGPPAQGFFDPQQLVVLAEALAARGRPRLDLAGARGHREIGDRRILRLAGPVRDDRAPPMLLRQT